jgi:hypothetical protein
VSEGHAGLDPATIMLPCTTTVQMYSTYCMFLIDFFFFFFRLKPTWLVCLLGGKTVEN